MAQEKNKSKQQELDIASGSFDINDVDFLWGGMPEFYQEDLSPWKHVNVRFRNEEDFLAFQKLIKQKIGLKQKTCWYPEMDPRLTRHMHYIDDES